MLSKSAANFSANGPSQPTTWSPASTAASSLLVSKSSACRSTTRRARRHSAQKCWKHVGIEKKTWGARPRIRAEWLRMERVAGMTCCPHMFNLNWNYPSKGDITTSLWPSVTIVVYWVAVLVPTTQKRTATSCPQILTPCLREEPMQTKTYFRPTSHQHQQQLLPQIPQMVRGFNPSDKVTVDDHHPWFSPARNQQPGFQHPLRKRKKCPFLNYRDHCPKYIPIIVEMFEAHPKSSPFDMFHSNLKPPTCKKKRKIFQKILLNGSR